MGEKTLNYDSNSLLHLQQTERTKCEDKNVHFMCSFVLDTNNAKKIYSW